MDLASMNQTQTKTKTKTNTNTNTNTQKKTKKHPIYYLSSGDTVVQAENILFRFDLSILHSKSIVLQSILPITQISYLPHFDDERPLQLFETCANDVEKLLQVLLPLPNSPLPPLTTPEHFISLLAIASKYHIQSITSFATTQLHALPLTAMVPSSSKPSLKSKPIITSTSTKTSTTTIPTHHTPTKTIPVPVPIPIPTLTTTQIQTKTSQTTHILLDPLRKIAIWDQYHLDPKLLHSSYTTLTIRPTQSITFQLGLTLGVKRLVQLSNAREMYRERVGCKNCGGGGGGGSVKRKSLGVGLSSTGMGQSMGMGRKERWKIAEEVVDEIFYGSFGSTTTPTKAGNSIVGKEKEILGIKGNGNGNVTMTSSVPLLVDKAIEKKKPKVAKVEKVVVGAAENVSASATVLKIQKEKVRLGPTKTTTIANTNTNTNVPSRTRTKSIDSKIKLKTQSSPSSVLRA